MFEKMKVFALQNVDARGWVEIIVVCVMASVIWMKSLAHEAPTDQYQVAQSAPEIKYVDREVIVPKQVIIYRDKAKADLDLPAAVQQDADVHVLEATELSATDHPQTAVCLQNTSTGKSEMVVKLDPLPWLAAENTGEVGLSYGFSNTGLKARLHAREDLIEIKAIHFGVNGSLDNDGSTFAGIGAAWRW